MGQPSLFSSHRRHSLQSELAAIIFDRHHRTQPTTTISCLNPSAIILGHRLRPPQGNHQHHVGPPSLATLAHHLRQQFFAVYDVWRHILWLHQIKLTPDFGYMSHLIWPHLSSCPMFASCCTKCSPFESAHQIIINGYHGRAHAQFLVLVAPNLLFQKKN